jgi:phosphate-selective porin
MKSALLCAILCCALAGTMASAQPADDRYVTREEYERLVKRLDSVTTELATVKAQSLQQNTAPAKPTEEERNDIDVIVNEVRDSVSSIVPGDNRFVIAGYAFAGYDDHSHSQGTFNAGFNPIFLWKLTDRLSFESEVEIEVNSDDGDQTEVNLEYADFTYVFNDLLTIGAGKFKVPMGIFNQRLESAWINKLPDRPLPYSDEVGIAQESSIGAFLEGGAALGSQKINYEVWVGNGPGLNTDDPETAGQLNFDNFSDNNDNKAVGGRIGWLPIPYLELGYSIAYGLVNPHHFESVSNLTQAVDLSYVRTHDEIKGQIDFRIEWVLSQTDKATFDPTGELGFGPTRFNNDRNAGYVQLAYRPSQLDNKLLKNMEFVGRYDRLNVSENAPGGGWDQRFTIGLDYYVTPSFVVKTAYEFDDREHGDRDNAFMIQAAVGL